MSGVLFAGNYFCGNEEIERLAYELFLGIDFSAAIHDEVEGSIYRIIDSLGNGDANSLTYPFNEYMIVAWLAMNQEKLLNVNGEGTQLWNAFYRNPYSLPTKGYGFQDLHTDNSDYFLSSFTHQFCYFFCHYYHTSPGYLSFYENAAKADKQYFYDQGIEQDYFWGCGAGAAPDPVWYTADAILDNDYLIVSPQIIAGFLPEYGTYRNDLICLLSDGFTRYSLPDGSEILWRKSLVDTSWIARDIQGIDYSLMLFGLAADTLGKDFFTEQIDFFEDPCFLTRTENHIFETSIELYPNPTRDYVKVLGPHEFLEYNLFSIDGVFIDNGMIDGERIHVSGLQPGTYILKLSNGTEEGAAFLIILK